MNHSEIIIRLSGVYAAACCIGYVCVKLYERLPGKWFCDYGEEPSREHFTRRLVYKHGSIAAVIISGFLACVLFVRHGFSAEFFLYYLFCLVLEFIAVADMRFSIIPDQFIIAAAIPSVAVYITEAGRDFTWRSALLPFAGAASAVAVLFAINLLGKSFYKQDVLGMGDVKLYAVVGFTAGFPGALRVFLIMLFSTGICFAMLLVAKKLKSGEYRPLGPFICFASAVQLCFGVYIDKLINWYLSLIK